MPTFHVNWIAVILAAVAAMIIGTLWYGLVTLAVMGAIVAAWS